MNKKMRFLAKILINQSVRVKKWETVFIETQDAESGEFVTLLHKEAIKAGAKRIRIWWNPIEIEENIFKYGKLSQSKSLLKWVEENVKESHSYIKIKSGKVLPTRDGEHVVEYQKRLRPLINLYAHSDIRRVAFYYPGKNMAKRIGMSAEETLNLTYKACNVDYEQVEEWNRKLKELMEKTDQVRVVGKWTDISFSIKDIPTISSHGRRNMPDGEVFTAPVRKSTNGTILFDIPTHFHGITFSSIKLIIKNGRVSSAKSSNKEKNKIIDKLLNAHTQNRYLWEFAIGTNSKIKKPLKLTIFDEKLMGTIHFAIGKCYKMASNGNDDGTIHWDVIKNMKLPGSEIYFDGELVFKDGKILV